MDQKNNVFKWVLFFTFLITSALFPIQSKHVLASNHLDPPVPPIVISHDETGYVSFVGTGDGKPIELPGMVRHLLQPEEKASGYLEAYGEMFGLKDVRQELTLTKTDMDQKQQSFRYQQVFQGVPILAGELIVNLDAMGGMQSLSGEISPDLALDVVPSIRPETAQQTAVGAVAKAREISSESLEVSEPELWIYDEQLLRHSDRPAELVWRMEISNTFGHPLRELVLINAHSGGVSLHFNQIDTFWIEQAP